MPLDIVQIKHALEPQNQFTAAGFRYEVWRFHTSDEQRQAHEFHVTTRAMANQEQQQSAVVRQAAINEMRHGQESVTYETLRLGVELATRNRGAFTLGYTAMLSEAGSEKNRMKQAVFEQKLRLNQCAWTFMQS